jgi:hypothetical protein
MASVPAFNWRGSWKDNENMPVGNIQCVENTLESLAAAY